MDFLNLTPLDKDARIQYVVTTVQSQPLTVHLGPAQNVHQEWEPTQNRPSNGWFPSPAPRHSSSQRPEILSCQIIKPADPVPIDRDESPYIKGADIILDKDVLMLNTSAEGVKTNRASTVLISAPKTKIMKIKQKISSNSQTPIHLLKSGETYHSLGKLDNDKLEMVKSALKNIGNPLKNKKKTIYDGATKTRIKYKVIYPKDLNISETSEIFLKGEVVPKRKHDNTAHAPQPKPQYEANEELIDNSTMEEAPAKVTRSGRAVKTPKGRGPQETETKTRKHKFVNVLTCLRCHAKFSGGSKINRHYEQFPSHKPNNTHTNLFRCFLDIMKNCSMDEKSYIFVEQLEELIVKIRNMLPCMINNMDSNEGKLCCINEDLGKMLDMEPGKYNISVNEGLHCYEHGKDKCKHIPKNNTLKYTSDLNKPSQLWVAKHNEEIAMEYNGDTDCARTHSVDNWPTIKKRIKKYIPITSIARDNLLNGQPSSEQSDNTQIVVTKDSADPQLTNVWIMPRENHTENIENSRSLFKMSDSINVHALNMDSQQINADTLKLNNMPLQEPHPRNEKLITEPDQPAQDYKYLSSHFNIRSSPIKSSHSTFNKILIKGDNYPSFVKLTDDEQLPAVQNNVNEQKSDSSNMQIDITGMFSGLDSGVTKKSSSESITRSALDHTSPNELYENSPRDLSASVNLNALQREMNRKEYAMSSSMNSSNFCNISQSSMCQNDRLLSSGNTQLPQTDGMAGLCVNEGNMDNSRMGLQLLDHLGSDCLSFTDTELRNASLDLPLDLFPFNNTE